MRRDGRQLTVRRVFLRHPFPMAPINGGHAGGNGGEANGRNNGHERLARPREEETWVYSMRREMQEIIPGLFLGPNSCATKAYKEELAKARITHLIVVRQEVEARLMSPKFPSDFRYLEIQLPSVNYADIITHMPRACDFLDSCLDRGGRALVYCSDGISRGPAVVIGYLMYKRNMSYGDALFFVQRRRMCINVSGDLENQLMEYEPICRARRMVCDQGDSSAGSGRNNDKKRPLDDEDEVGPATALLRLGPTLTRRVDRSGGTSVAHGPNGDGPTGPEEPMDM